MIRPDPDQVLGEIVTATYTDGHTHAVGRVISYTDVPSYEIERADGTRFSWRADMISGDADAAAYWQQRALAAEAKLDGAA